MIAGWLPSGWWQRMRRVPDVHWTTYPAAFGGIAAAVAAVGIALSGNWRNRRARPQLRLVYDQSTRDFAAGVVHGRQHWIRLRVENKRAGRAGRRSADDVEVLVAGAAHDDGSDLTQLEGCRFKWSNVQDQEGSGLTRLTIPPGVARRFDLLSIYMPRVSDGAGGQVDAGEDGTEGALAQLQLEPIPADASARLASGKLTLTLALTARDTDATNYQVDIDYDGKWWSAEALPEHLAVGVSRVG